MAQNMGQQVQYSNDPLYNQQNQQGQIGMNNPYNQQQQQQGGPQQINQFANTNVQQQLQFSQTSQPNYYHSQPIGGVPPQQQLFNQQMNNPYHQQQANIPPPPQHQQTGQQDYNTMPNLQNLSIHGNLPTQPTQQQQYFNPQQQQTVPPMNIPYQQQQQQQGGGISTFIPGQQQHTLPQNYNTGLPPTQQQQGQFGLPQNIQANIPQQQQTPAPRIAANQIPSSTAILDQYKGYIYKTNQESLLPPPSSIQQFCIDSQNSKPNFMRSTLYTIPETEDVLNQTHIPFVIHTTPFASSNHPQESIVPQIVHPGSPVQCKRCHAYTNPFNQFTNGGKYFICKFCEFENQVEKEYFSAVLPNGQRTDFLERPELQHGSYEFLLSTPVVPQLPAYIFVIEVSAFTVQNGILQVVIESLKRIFSDMSDKIPSRIGIITYDTEVQFWSFKKTYSNPQMKVLSKSSIFVPILDDGFLVDYKESKHLIDYFFENIQQFFRHPHAISREFAFGAAIQSATLALEKCGGRVIAFTSNLPKGTPGEIARREKSLQPLSAAVNGFYKPVYQQCVKMSVSVDLFCIPAEVCDLPTTGLLSSQTGGHIYCYPNYVPDYHSDQLYTDIIYDVTMEFGFNATAKVRCSSGITVQSHFGNFSEVNNEIQLAGISTGKTISTLIKYDDKLKPKSKAYIQFAMIYVNLKGESRIRVHNLRLNTDSVFVSYFKDADLDSIITYLARVASKDIASSGPSNIRTNIVDKSVEILAAYRKYCAADKSPSQLILPELFKLLPVYILSMMKTPPFRLSSDISPDIRYFYMNQYTSSPPNKIIPLIYPRMYPIHSLQPHEGLPAQQPPSHQHPLPEHIVLPHFIRLSADQLAQNGIYLIDDGRSIQFWIHQFASAYQLKQLFDVESIVGYNSKRLYQAYESQRGTNEYHTKVDNIIKGITQLRGYQFRSLQFSQSTQSDPVDSYLKSIFYEDKGVDSISYVDFLCQVHKQIQNKLS